MQPIRELRIHPNFEEQAASARERLPNFDRLVGAAKFRLTREPDLTIYPICGYGASAPMFGLRTTKTEISPHAVFYFTLDSSGSPQDVVTLHGALAESS